MIRKSILTISLTFLLLLLVLFNGWNLFKINDAVKQIVLSRIQLSVGEQCTIETLRLGFGSINLNGIKLIFDDAPYEVWIEELRLGYSLKSLLQGNPRKTTDEITIFKPRVTLTYDNKTEERPNLDLKFKLSDEEERKIRSIIKEYDFIKKITISDGEILLQNQVTDKTSLIAQKVSGWAYTDEKKHAWLRLGGHLFNSNELNMIMYGQLDLKQGRLDYINIDMHDYEIGHEAPFLLPDYFEVLGGTINGNLTVTENTETGSGFNIEGAAELTNGQLKLTSKDIYFEDINIAAEVKDWNVEIKKASQKVFGSPTRLEGRIVNLLQPEFDLSLKSDRFRVENCLEQVVPKKKLPFLGYASFDFKITEDLHNPKITGIIKSDSIQLYYKKIHDLTADVAFENFQLRFKRLTASIDQAQLDGTGGIDFKDPEKDLLNLEFSLDGDFTKDLHRIGLTSANVCKGKANLKWFGSLLQPVSSGDYNLNFSKDEEETLVLTGKYRYTQQRFVLNASSERGDFKLNVSADSIFIDPKLSIDATNLENAFVFVNDPFLEFLRHHYNLKLVAEGEKKNLDVTVTGFQRDDYEKLFKIETNSKFGSQILHSGRIHLLPNSEEKAEGVIELKIADNGSWSTDLQIGQLIEGHFSSDSSNAENINGKLTISGMKMSMLTSLAGTKTSNFTGDVFGQVKIKGNPDAPEYSGNLWLLNGFLGSMGPLESEFAFKADNERLEIKNFNLDDRGSMTLRLQGDYIYASDEVDIDMVGANVKLEEIVKLASGREESPVSGNILLNTSLKGPLHKLPLYGRIEMDDFQVLQFHFDDVDIDLGEPRTGSQSFVTNRILYFSDATIRKKDNFTMSGTILLPFSSLDKLDIDLLGQGNLLASLSDLAELFVDSESQGEMRLKMTGEYTSPVFAGSRLKFSDGQMKLSTVARDVTNITGEVIIHDDDYFLEIVQLDGLIKGNPISITNTNNLIGLNHGIYEPLRVAGDDINLGALIIETSEKGVPIHIPGLMERGEIGWYAFDGKFARENFFVAGPWEHPVVRGKITVRDANLIFPFDEKGGSPDPLVQNIIDNINWDVDSFAEHGTRYVKQLPAGVYVNMEVDKENSMLQFNGVLKDSTFTIDGTVESTRGEIEYFDLNFRVEKIGAEFNQSSLYPIVYGKAWTVVRDSTNIPNNVYLELYTVDDLNQEVQKGRWDRINVKVTSDYPGLVETKLVETQAEAMATLGYTSETMDEQAVKAVGSSTDNFIFRPLFRPIERRLEQQLGLDVVRFSYAIAQNFLDSSFNNDEFSSSLALLRSSRLILGKYLTDDMYLIYSGELKTGPEYRYRDKGIGLQHIVGLEYRLNSRWLLQMEYDYNTLLETHKDDKKVWLRHSFPF